MENQHYPFANVPLPYGYAGLEPFIDAKTMRLHHDKHLQTYIDNLNNALKDRPAYHNWTLERLICLGDTLPAEIRTAAARNAGGVYNHFFYFNGLANKAQKEPSGEIAAAINKTFGSSGAFKNALKDKGLSVFGSGYAWLVLNEKGGLELMITANQETPLTANLCPLLNLDVWEHAYYLKHFNVRAAYIDDFFNVVNWDEIGERYSAAKK